MKKIPFPFSLNIGTDIVHIPRIHRLITRPPSSLTPNSKPNTYLGRFTRRILCEQENIYFRSRFLQQQSSPSAPSIHLQNTADAARWLAGRFAAKEAARKAAPGGASAISWKDVMVQAESGGDGRPEVIYLKDGGDTGEVGKLSISHDGEYVIAMVVAAGPNS